MSKPEDYSKGLEMFWEFHQLEPKKIGGFSGSFKIPSALYHAGEALWVAYASTKWSGKRINYIHDHEGGVKCYRPDSGGTKKETPYAAKNAKTLVRLGDCLGFGYSEGADNEVEGKVSKPYPELYCTPDGSVLLVITNKRRLIAMMWGGGLNVTARGIVG